MPVVNDTSAAPELLLWRFLGTLACTGLVSQRAQTSPNQEPALVGQGERTWTLGWPGNDDRACRPARPSQQPNCRHPAPLACHLGPVMQLEHPRLSNLGL